MADPLWTDINHVGRYRESLVPLPWRHRALGKENSPCQNGPPNSSVLEYRREEVGSRTGNVDIVVRRHLVPYSAEGASTAPLPLTLEARKRSNAGQVFFSPTL
jgi:hypothetical protein